MTATVEKDTPQLGVEPQVAERQTVQDTAGGNDVIGTEETDTAADNAPGEASAAQADQTGQDEATEAHVGKDVNAPFEDKTVQASKTKKPQKANTSKSASAKKATEAKAGGSASKASSNPSRKKPAASKSEAAVPTPDALARPRRDRKQVELFNPVTPKTNTGPEVVEGDGEKLREIAIVKYKFDHHTPDDEIIKLLHRAVFGSDGVRIKRKRDLLDFQGFKGASSSDTKVLIERAHRSVESYKVAHLHEALDLFGLPRGSGDEGTKESKVERLIDFLKSPSDTGKKVPSAQSLKKTVKPANKGSGSGKKGTKRELEKDDDGKDGAHGEEEAPKKKVAKKAKTPTKKRKQEESTSTEAAPPTPKKTKKMPTQEKEKVTAKENGKKEKKTPEMPSDDAVKEAVLAAMQAQSGNKELSMKDLNTALKASHGFSAACLKSKKALIKATALGVLEDAEDGADDVPAEAAEVDEGEPADAAAGEPIADADAEAAS